MAFWQRPSVEFTFTIDDIACTLTVDDLNIGDQTQTTTST